MHGIIRNPRARLARDAPDEVSCAGLYAVDVWPARGGEVVHLVVQQDAWKVEVVRK